MIILAAGVDVLADGAPRYGAGSQDRDDPAVHIYWIAGAHKPDPRTHA
jgi:hypothetical protein